MAKAIKIGFMLTFLAIKKTICLDRHTFLIWGYLMLFGHQNRFLLIFFPSTKAKIVVVNLVGLD